MTRQIMKTEASKDKGSAAERYRQRFDRLYVNRARNHIQIIVIGSLLNLLGTCLLIFFCVFFQFVEIQKKKSQRTSTVINPGRISPSQKDIFIYICFVLSCKQASRSWLVS